MSAESNPRGKDASQESDISHPGRIFMDVARVRTVKGGGGGELERSAAAGNSHRDNYEP